MLGYFVMLGNTLICPAVHFQHKVYLFSYLNEKHMQYFALHVLVSSWKWVTHCLVLKDASGFIVGVDYIPGEARECVGGRRVKYWAPIEMNSSAALKSQEVLLEFSPAKLWHPPHISNYGDRFSLQRRIQAWLTTLVGISVHYFN